MKTKLLLMLFVAFVSASAGAAEVAILNPSFEDPELNDAGRTMALADWIEGWYNLEVDPNYFFHDYDYGCGVVDPNGAYGYGGIVPEGENIAYCAPYGGYDQGLYQVLSETLQAGWVYELSVLVGNPAGWNGGLPTCDYRLELAAGGVRIASTNDIGSGYGVPSPAPDTWETAILEFSPGADHPQIGQPLEIRLLAVSNEPQYEVNFEDVRFDAISDPMKPNPPDGDYVYVGDVDLSWTNMDPNTPGDDVYVDVYFGEDPTKWKLKDHVIDATDPEGINATTVTVSADDDQTTYYWQVNSYIYGSPTGDPIEGRIYKVHATTDKPPSAEIVSADMVTWSGEAVQLDATVEDDELSGPLTIEWSAVPDDGVVFSDPNVEDPIVTITNDFTRFPIVEPGFEDPVLADGGATMEPTGWEEGYYYTPEPDPTAWTSYSYGCGVINPSAGYGYDGIAPQGDNIAFCAPYPGYDQGLRQVLSYMLQASWTYELSALVGNPAGRNGGGATCDYRMELAAGGVAVASTNNNGIAEGDPAPDPDTWTTASLTFTPEPNHPQLGEPLEIRLIAVDNVAELEVSFDQVKLSADSFYYTGGVPTPVKLTLFVDDHFEFNPPVEKTMTIDVYDDACYAAIGAGEVNPSDINTDCITGLEDLAEMLLTWTDDNALTEPKVEEPGSGGGSYPEPVGLWLFDDGGGTMAADSGTGGNDGTLEGDAAFVNDPDRGSVIEFSGDGWVDVPAFVAEISAANFSISTWFKTSELGMCILSKSNGDGGWTEQERQMYISDSATSEGDLDGAVEIVGWGNMWIRGSQEDLNDDLWHHVVITWDYDALQGLVYVDGVEGTYESSYAGNPDNEGDTVRIGYTEGEHSENFIGRIDDVAIFDQTLTAGEILELFETGFVDKLNPSPADGGYIHPSSELELSWTNMDPNTPGDSVWVDVWFGSDPNEQSPYHDYEQVVEAGENTTSVMVDASTLGETYYWQVNSYIYGSSHINEPNMIEGRLWKFDTVTDIPVSVNAGGDVVTWSGREVQLDGTVDDHGEGDVEMIAWSANPEDGVVFSDPSVEDPTVTITKATDNPSVVRLTLSAEDGIGSAENTMKIEVYDTACLAAIGEGEEFDPGDFDADCDTDIEDYAEMALTWLVDYTLTEPAVKP